MLKEFVCIMCPQGCSLEVEMEEGQVKEVRGNTCPKGEQYALQEALSPMRNIATSVLVDGGSFPWPASACPRPFLRRTSSGQWRRSARYMWRLR